MSKAKSFREEMKMINADFRKGMSEGKEKNRLLKIELEQKEREKEEARRIKREAKENARIQRIRDSVGNTKTSKGPNPFLVLIELLWMMALSLPLLIMTVLVLVFAGFLIWSLIF